MSGPAGIMRWVCVHAANGPSTWVSRNWQTLVPSRQASLVALCSATQRTLAGGVPSRITARSPGWMPSAWSSRTVCHGGESRSNAPGRACQSKSAEAGTGMRERAEKVGTGTDAERRDRKVGAPREDAPSVQRDPRDASPSRHADWGAANRAGQPWRTEGRLGRPVAPGGHALTALRASRAFSRASAWSTIGAGYVSPSVTPAWARTSSGASHGWWIHRAGRSASSGTHSRT